MKRAFLVLLVLLVCGFVYSQTRGITRNWKFTHSGAVDIGLVCPQHNPACALAWWNFETAVAGTYADDANGYVMTVNGAPTLEDDYTHPLGLGNAEGMGWSFDGAADWLSRADDGTFDPATYASGDFMVLAVVTPDTIAAGEDCIAAKWESTGNLRGWKLCRSADDIVFSLSVDGTVITTVTHLACLLPFRPAYISAVYDLSTTTATVFVDNGNTANAAMSAAVFDTTADFEIGASDTGATLWEGTIHDLKVYMDRANIAASQHGQLLTQFQGRMSTANHTLNMTGASPPALPLNTVASGVEPFLIDIPVDTTVIGEVVAGSGGLYSPGALTSKWWRGSCETDDGAGDCLGWLVADNIGGGGATVTINRDATTSAHGGSSVLFTADGGGLPKYAVGYSACQNAWINQDLTLISYGVTTSGTASCRMRIAEYSGANCVTNITNINVWGPGNPGANWTELKGTFAAAAWNVATVSWRVLIQCDATGTGYTANFDAFMALQAPATYDTDASCTTDADADAVCTTVVNIDNSSPLTAGNWTIRGTWRSPMDGAETTPKYIFLNDATAGANNRAQVTHFTDTLRCAVYDSGGGIHTSTVGAASNADEDWDFEIYHTDTGRVGCCAKTSAAAAWTCGAEAVGATMDGVSLNYHLGYDDGIWVRDVTFWRRLVR